MALAKKCDRCGNLYEARNQTIRERRVNGIILMERFRNNTEYDKRGYIDLCPRCLESFNYWLQMDFGHTIAINEDEINIVEYADKEDEK